ncbi:MAG: SURF1 family protein [Actinomycetota bacterium]
MASQSGGTPAADWSFARRPFWLFSHVFAASVVALFVVLGLWQWARHNERAALNETIGARSNPPAVAIDTALDAPDDEIAYRYITATGTYVDDDLVRVGNRSQAGAAGEHVVAVLRLDDGRHLLVNRGFVPIAVDVTPDPVPDGVVTVQGWLQESVARGWLGATDTGEGTLVPRLDVEAVAGRLGDPDAATVVPFWLQLEGRGAGDGGSLASFPDPVPLPPLDGGPHLSYMGQWFIFAVLGLGFYGALLRRTARTSTRPKVPAAT